MAVVVPAPPALSGDLTLFHTTDPLLSNSPLLIFYGPATTIASTSSRIQVHILTPAGLGSYARLAVSPNSPFYTAVSNLPREEQGDEVCRGIAFGLRKYFTELPAVVRNAWVAQACVSKKGPSASALFSDAHIAILASRMTKIENVQEVVRDVKRAYAEQLVPWTDVDVVLPPGSIADVSNIAKAEGDEERAEEEIMKKRYGVYAQLVQVLGEPAFLPTSRMQRAPSKPTAVGRSISFLKHQKESVRKELCELLDTEETFAKKIDELVNEIAKDLRSATESSESKRRQVDALFPDSLTRIANANAAFLEAFSTIFAATEEEALSDIMSSPDAHTSSQQSRQDFQDDPQGISAIAKCFCDWFPTFAECYPDYMRSHAKSSQIIRSLAQAADPGLSTQLQDIGEQQLTSLLIEPVQRLPRYTLYIDSIAKQLPLRHPALKHLLKARDIISDICSQEDVGDRASKVQDALRSCVNDWPVDGTVNGRLITAVDAAELAPPYNPDASRLRSNILLLFTGGLIVLEKVGPNATAARTLLAEIDSSLTSRPDSSRSLRYLRHYGLDAMHCTSGLDECDVCIFNMVDEVGDGSKRANSCDIFHLEGTYEGKASRLMEEIVKAEVEKRFSEPERECGKWEPRAAQPVAERLGLFFAVFDNSESTFVEGRGSPASTRIVVDSDKHPARPKTGQDGVKTTIFIAPVREGLWRLEVESTDGDISREHVSTSDVPNVIARRLGSLLSSRFAIDHPSMTGCSISRNGELLDSLDLLVRPNSQDGQNPNPGRERVHRPNSPVKLLSNFLSSVGPGSHPPTSKKELPPLPSMGHIPRMPPPAQPGSKPPSRESRPSSKDQLTPKSTTSMSSSEQTVTPIKKLEDTLSTYLLALQARKGNIVGRSLKARVSADELAVNELYNSLLEDSNMMVLAAQATVDVLFAAFEKFLNIAWKAQVGPVLPWAMLQSIQSKAETLFPTDFEEYFKSAVSDLAPQNQRALRGIIKLLAELLDGTGNDGDRGSLTAAFAEVLVTEGDPHQYIALLDRFVDDLETYFGETVGDGHSRPELGHSSSHKRARSVNTGSLSSNTSSLRKKFGFGTLSRENSKSEQESKVSSVWRTLSKTGRDDKSPASSISKGTVNRSRSTDVDARGLPRRPSSQDGPSTHNFLAGEDQYSQNGRSIMHNQSLVTLEEHPSQLPVGPPRKKRRSSLSDLKMLQASQESPAWSPPTTRRPAPVTRTSDDKPTPTSPSTPLPLKIATVKTQSARFGSPSRDSPRSRLPSSFRKENSPGVNKAYCAAEPAQRTSSAKPDEVTITARPTSNIPTLAPRTSFIERAPSSTPVRTGLYERPSSGNSVKKPSLLQEKAVKSAAVEPTTASQPKRLRMQSPQKLRERLQNEQSATSASQNSLQDELSKIGDELTATPSKIGSVRTKPSPVRGGLSSNMDLAARVLKMESQLSKVVDELTAKSKAIQDDLGSSLVVSENKSKKLDDLYREANAENEALYARFNDELGRVLKAVKGGEGAEELRKQLKSSQDEAARLRKENSRLKRENVGLRAQLKE